MSASLVKPPTELLNVSALVFRNRSTRRGQRWDGALGALLGRRHAIREDLRGVPCFSFAVAEPGADQPCFGAVVLPFELEAEPAFLQTGLLHTLAFVLVTDFDHRRDGSDDYRFRLVVPLSRAVGAHDHRVLARALDDELGGLADWRRERRDRRWTMPVCPPERAELATLRYGTGAPLDVDEYLGTRVSAGLRRLA